MVRQLYPAWPSHSLENVAMRLNVAGGAEHRALPDARLVKDVFLELLRRNPTVKKFSDLRCVSQPLTFVDAPVCAIELPAGFEVLATALAERSSVAIM
jgi:DNA polymerase III epsilon subunit-like protein